MFVKYSEDNLYYKYSLMFVNVRKNTQTSETAKRQIVKRQMRLLNIRSQYGTA